MKQGKKSSTAIPAIDWKLCLKLASNQEIVAQEILSMLLQEWPTGLEAIKKAQAKPDYPELLRRVHKLHGSLCYSGMARLKDAVISLENVLKQDIFDSTQLRELGGKL